MRWPTMRTFSDSVARGVSKLMVRVVDLLSALMRRRWPGWRPTALPSTLHVCAQSTIKLPEAARSNSTTLWGSCWQEPDCDCWCEHSPVCFKEDNVSFDQAAGRFWKGDCLGPLANILHSHSSRSTGIDAFQMWLPGRHTDVLLCFIFHFKFVCLLLLHLLYVLTWNFESVN